MEGRHSLLAVCACGMIEGLEGGRRVELVDRVQRILGVQSVDRIEGILGIDRVGGIKRTVDNQAPSPCDELPLSLSIVYPTRLYAACITHMSAVSVYSFSALDFLLPCCLKFHLAGFGDALRGIENFQRV